MADEKRKAEGPKPTPVGEFNITLDEFVVTSPASATLLAGFRRAVLRAKEPLQRPPSEWKRAITAWAAQPAG